jgi:hypothetical protein
MSYVALAAGAIVSVNSSLNSLVWSATAILFCYAAVTLCYARGKRQAVALGFVILSSAYFAVLCLFPVQTPAARLFNTLGYGVSNQGLLFARDSAPIIQIVSRTTLGPDRSFANSYPIVGATNALGTTLAGLIGCAIGALAYRHSHDP